jgi:hypothetical protein
MIKVIGLLKRKPGMSPEEFRNYYETYHRVLGEKYLRPFAVRYMRRYLTPFADPITGNLPEQSCDVVLEIWYPDKATYDLAGKTFSQPEVAGEIAEDEENLFDRPSNRFFFVEEADSKLGD